MLDYLYGHDQVVAHFAAQLIPHCHRGFGANCKAIGVIDEQGFLIAGMVYHNWDPDAAIIEMSGAALPGKYWLTRETLARIFGYPFQQCRCQMVVMRVQADNERLLYILARYGFAFHKVPRLYGRDRDGVFCTLTDDAWISNKFNKRREHHLEPAMDEAA